MKTKKLKKGGSKTKIYYINNKQTIPITRKEKKMKSKIKNHSNNSEKNFFKRLFNKYFKRKKSFKFSPILIPPSQNLKTRKSNTSSSQRKKIKALANSLPKNVIGYNINDGYIYANK